MHIIEHSAFDVSKQKSNVKISFTLTLQNFHAKSQIPNYVPPSKVLALPIKTESQ